MADSATYDRARLNGELDYRRQFGWVGGTGARSTQRFDLAVEFDTAQDDPLLLALVYRLRKQSEEEAMRYYANYVSMLGDF